jgi:hypothetical protein
MLIYLLCSHVVSLLLESNVYFRCLSTLFACCIMYFISICMWCWTDLLMHVLYLTVYHIHRVDLWWIKNWNKKLNKKVPTFYIQYILPPNNSCYSYMIQRSILHLPIDLNNAIIQLNLNSVLSNLMHCHLVPAIRMLNSNWFYIYPNLHCSWIFTAISSLVIECTWFYVNIFFIIKCSTSTFAPIVKVCLSKVGIYVNMKVLEPYMRKLCKLRCEEWK